MSETLRLTPADDGLNLWSDEAVQSLIGQKVALKIFGETDAVVRITDARVDDGWVTVETEPADD